MWKKKERERGKKAIEMEEVRQKGLAAGKLNRERRMGMKSRN